MSVLDGDGSLLVVAAHADDEVLGAAGTMALAARHGRDVHGVVLSTSVRSREIEPCEAERIRTSRRRDAQRAADLLGATLEVHDLPDNSFDTVPGRAIATIVEAAVARVRPSIVLTHWPYDLSADHQLTARAVMVACRPSSPASPRSILSFEVRSSTDWQPGGVPPTFAPTVFVGLDEAAWDAKVQALRCYADELRDEPHARSLRGVDALSQFRGTQVGCERAEAFVMLRAIVTP